MDEGRGGTESSFSHWSPSSNLDWLLGKKTENNRHNERYSPYPVEIVGEICRAPEDQNMRFPLSEQSTNNL